MKKLPPFFPFVLTCLQCLVAWSLLQVSVNPDVWYGARMAFGAMGLVMLIQANWTYANALRGGQ